MKAERPTDVSTYDDPRTFPANVEVLALFRETWRKQGQRHQLVDRWRFELGWRIAPSAVRAWLQADLETVH